MIIQGQEQKQDIGLVESGNMKLDEFVNKKIMDQMPYDVVEDLHFHMIDDDAFYRKYYLPVIDKIRSETNNDIIQGHLMPMVNKGLNHYCNKYDITPKPDKLMSEADKADLCSRIMEYEKNPPKDLDNAPA